MGLDRERLIAQVIAYVEKLGLSGCTPRILSDRGNLIVQLAPYPVVARLATMLSQEDEALAFATLEREIRVAEHLRMHGVPVITPTTIIERGPHGVEGTMMTAWDFVHPMKLGHPSPDEAFQLVLKLSEAMKSYDGELPILGVWERTRCSVARLTRISDQRLQKLLSTFHELDLQICQKVQLVPAHGDAHVGNLLPSRQGWLWMDFEDVSYMPGQWDIASFVANLVLFRGFHEPTFKYFVDHVADLHAFSLALAARILMSTLGNLDLALRGNGDMVFAARQLAVAGDSLEQIESIIR